MENISDVNWESIFQVQEYKWPELDETLFDFNSSSPDGTQSSSASKNSVSEKNRRMKLNDRLNALRLVVPNISKMDKASTIKDAIDYIQKLQEEERTIQAEIMDLESQKLELQSLDFGEDTVFMTTSFDPTRSRTPYDIEVTELNVTYVEEKTVMVSLKCSKRRDTIVKLCEVFESLKLQIISVNISAFCDKLFNTFFIQVEDEDTDFLKIQIETAISVVKEPNSLMSM